MSDNLDNAMRVMADQSRQIERLRAALVAAMPVVRNARHRFVSHFEDATGELAAHYASAIEALDSIIAQADAAMGSEG